MDFYSNLSAKDWASLLPFGVACAAIGFSAKIYLDKKCCGSKGGRCNTKIKMADSKVVDTFDMEDIGNKAVYCRCWKSSKFPYCDGSHNKHNDTTGDNVGPLIIKKKE